MMATIYKVEVTASSGASVDIAIIDSLNPLPGSDAWEVDDAIWFGRKSGPVASWGAGNSILTMGAGDLTLEGFRKSTEPDDHGKGSKNTLEGRFPDGELAWTCICKS